MKKPILFFSVLLTIGSLRAEDIFKKHGYEKEILTLSKGRYEEVFNNEQVVKIGSVLLNTKTNKVVKFLEEENEISSFKVEYCSRFVTVDPLAEKYPWISPYAFCANNPVRFIDPDGMDVYRYDHKTEELVLAVKNDDDSDQIGRFKYNKNSGEYELKTNRKGEAKTHIDNIEKGILSDGINFKENDNVIAVGGENQATIAGVQDFIINLSEMIGKEIGGFQHSQKGGSEPTSVYIGKYKNNTATEAKTGFNARVTGLTPNQIDIHVDFHTHLSRFADSDRLFPSGRTDGRGDIGYKKSQSKNGIKRFIILTKGHAPISY